MHIYRFVSQHTVEEALLRKANQKRSLDDLVIQKGEFDWRTLFKDENALTKALGEVEDTEDAHAAAVAAREEVVMYGADQDDFGGGDGEGEPASTAAGVVGKEHGDGDSRMEESQPDGAADDAQDPDANEEDNGDEGGTVVDHMLSFVQYDYEFFREWKL